MSPPKEKVTIEIALNVLWDFLICKNEPIHYDKKKLAQTLRKQGYSVPIEVNNELSSMCKLRNKSWEYHAAWGKFMTGSYPKSPRQELKEFYESVIKEAQSIKRNS